MYVNSICVLESTVEEVVISFAHPCSQHFIRLATSLEVDPKDESFPR